MSAKQFLKYKEKVVVEKDYLILDCTDGQESRMNKFTSTVSMDNFIIPTKLTSVMDQTISDEYIDLDSVEELEKNFFRGKKFSTSVLATMSTFLRTEDDKDINIFIVIRNKAFKYYRKKFVSEFCRAFPEAASLIYIYDSKDRDKMKKALKKNITNGERQFLKKELEKIEKRMEEEAKLELKKKKKSKKSKKKSKGWGFSKGYDDL